MTKISFLGSTKADKGRQRHDQHHSVQCTSLPFHTRIPVYVCMNHNLHLITALNGSFYVVCYKTRATFECTSRFIASGYLTRRRVYSHRKNGAQCRQSRHSNKQATSSRGSLPSRYQNSQSSCRVTETSKFADVYQAGACKHIYILEDEARRQPRALSTVKCIPKYMCNYPRILSTSSTGRTGSSNSSKCNARDVLITLQPRWMSLLCNRQDKR